MPDPSSHHVTANEPAPLAAEEERQGFTSIGYKGEILKTLARKNETAPLCLLAKRHLVAFLSEVGKGALKSSDGIACTALHCAALRCCTTIHTTRNSARTLSHCICTHGMLEAALKLGRVLYNDILTI